MASREYFLKQAETCLRLVAGPPTLTFSDQLRALAAEFQAKAEEAKSDPPKDK